MPLGHADQLASITMHSSHGEQSKLRLLIVEDDPSIRAASAAIANHIGLDPDPVESLSAARVALRERTIDLVLLDVRVGAENGLALLDELRTLPVVITTAFATVGSAVAALRADAFDYIEKPFSVEELIAVLEGAASQAMENRRKQDACEQLRADKDVPFLSSRSPGVQKLRRIAARVAGASHPVLIEGELGTEKEMLARSIHSNGLTPSAPFVSVDCSSCSADGLHRLLFGGTLRTEQSMCGALVSETGGTVFFNEIGRLPFDLQGALQTALANRTVELPYSSQGVPMTARIIAASSDRLDEIVSSGGFRRELFLRLNVINLRIAPLRERRVDIPQLASVILDRISNQSNRPRKFARDVIRHLMEYDWPGNLTELENAIEYACLVAGGDEVHLSDLPDRIQEHVSTRIELPVVDRSGRPYQLGILSQSSPSSGSDFVQSIAEIEKQAILNAIEQMNGDKLLAAKLLGIGKTTLYRKLKEYQTAEVVSREDRES